MERLAFVTGGGSGLGAASCHALAAAGHRVAVVDLNGANAEKVAKSLPGSGHMILVCFAGGTFNTDTYRPSITTMSTDEWGRTETLNARSTFFCLREYLRCRE